MFCYIVEKNKLLCTYSNFFSSGASKPNTNPNGDSKPMNSVLNAAQSAQRREGI